MKVIIYLKGKIKTIIIIVIPFIAVPKNIVIFFILTVGTVKLGL